MEHASNCKKDLIKRIGKYCHELYMESLESEGDPLYKLSDYRRIQEDLERCTVDQLWSLYLFVERGTKFKILGGIDPLGITFAGMFVGIETDGYAHS